MSDHAWLRHQSEAEQARNALAVFGRTELWVERGGEMHHIVYSPTTKQWYDVVTLKDGVTEKSAYPLDRIREQTKECVHAYLIKKQARRVA